MDAGNHKLPVTTFFLPGPGTTTFVILPLLAAPNMEYLKLPFIPKRFTPSIGRWHGPGLLNVLIGWSLEPKLNAGFRCLVMSWFSCLESVLSKYLAGPGPRSLAVICGNLTTWPSLLSGILAGVFRVARSELACNFAVNTRANRYLLKRFQAKINYFRKADVMQFSTSAICDCIVSATKGVPIGNELYLQEFFSVYARQRFSYFFVLFLL